MNTHYRNKLYESVCIINLKMYHWRFLRFSFLGAQYWSGGHGLYNLESTLNEKLPTLLFHKLKHCNYWKDFFNCPMLLYYFVGSSENPRISHSFNSLWWYLHYCNILYCSSVFLKKITANGFHTIFLCWTLNPPGAIILVLNKLE